MYSLYELFIERRMIESTPDPNNQNISRFAVCVNKDFPGTLGNNGVPLCYYCMSLYRLCNSSDDITMIVCKVNILCLILSLVCI